MPKRMVSALTGKLTTYREHVALMTCQQAAPVPPESLKTLMNSSLLENQVDAVVEEVKIIQGAIDTNVQCKIWIGQTQEAALDAAFIALVFMVLVVCVTALAGVYILLSTAQTIIERFWPQAKFYQIDAAGNQIVVSSLAEYITCQRAANPDKYVCGYCGQVFDTEAKRDAHQTTCPWLEGVPGAPPPWQGLVVIGLGTVTVIVGLWALAKILGRK